MFFIIKRIRFLGLVFRNSRQTGLSPFPILTTYLKLLTKLIFHKIFKINYKKEKILNFVIFLFNYEVLVALFESIFIENEYYFQAANPLPAIIDVGSNIGVSVLYFKYLYPKSKIIAFEPDPETFKLLHRTIESNKLKNVKLHQIAVSDKKGIAYFYNDQDNPGSLLMSLRKERLPKDKVRVKTDVLSKYIPKDLDLLKMDIEGAEEEVIPELSKHMSLRKVRYLVFEYHHHIDLNKDSFSNILGYLERNGFGYQIVSKLRSPVKQLIFQDILVYAKRK